MIRNFTPGPWSSKDHRVCANVRPGDPPCVVICDTANNKISRSKPHNQANADLIAQAPAMLLALELVARGLARIEGSEFCFDGMRYSHGGDYSEMFDIIGWDKARRWAAGKR